MPEAQSASLAHEVLHDVAPQTYGAQFSVPLLTHETDEPLHVSWFVCVPLEHDCASPQVVPADFRASAGQVFSVPLHDSARSQTPAAARQAVPEAATASAGHAALLPGQVSATSQRSVTARQVVPDAR